MSVSGILPDSDSEDELPPAWEERATSDGHVFYINHQNKTTQWTHPRTGKSKQVSGELPLGWERKIEKDTGRTIFIDTKNVQTTYTDPRLAFAIEELPKNIGEVRQRYDAGTTALQVLHGKDLTGKLALVTGANCGIGYETAKSLAAHGCDVILACRNRKSAEDAIIEITKYKPTAGKRCQFMHIDLSSLSSIKQFCDEFKQIFEHLDILILNAAVFGLPHSTTADNFETTFQVCHLAHFYLTTSLESAMNYESRVVIVSSESHRYSSLTSPSNLDKQTLSPPAQKYWSMQAYNNAKLCNVLFCRELAKRWQKKGICVYALHPGNVVSSSLSRNWWLYRLFFAIVRPFTKSLQQAASTTIYCATASELTGISGQYYNNCFFCEPSPAAQNVEMADYLWELSERLIKESTTL